MSFEPLFLTFSEVISIHSDQILRYGGPAFAFVRDIELIKSALAMPQSGSGGKFFHSDITEMAAAYLFHIVKDHPFVDGNKRVGAMCAYVFLALNGFVLDAPEDEFEKLVFSVAAGKTTKKQVTAFLRKHSHKQS